MSILFTVFIGSSHLHQRLTEKVKETIWDSLPLCAIAEAHKKKGHNIVAQGDPDDESTTNAFEAYVEYSKYLLLYPHKDHEEYASTHDSTQGHVAHRRGRKRFRERCTCWKDLLTVSLPQKFVPYILLLCSALSPSRAIVRSTRSCATLLTPMLRPKGMDGESATSAFSLQRCE
jgi:hypothetical protein